VATHVKLMEDGVHTETGPSVQRSVALGHRLGVGPVINQFLLMGVWNV